MVTYSLSHRKQLRHRLSPCNELPAIWQKQGMFWGIGYHSRWGESAGRESLGWSRVQTSELPTSWKDTCLVWGSYIKFTRVDREKKQNKTKKTSRKESVAQEISHLVLKNRESLWDGSSGDWSWFSNNYIRKSFEFSWARPGLSEKDLLAEIFQNWAAQCPQLH